MPSIWYTATRPAPVFEPTFLSEKFEASAERARTAATDPE